MELRGHLKRIEYGCRWLWIGVATIACGGAAELRVLMAPRGARADLYARFARRWGRLFLLGSRCTLEGAQNIPRDRAVILASNHQSAFDIPLFHALMPVGFRWVSKRVFFSWPFIGRALRNMRAIGVVPGSRGEIRGAWREAVEALKAGHNLVIFPEGTWGDREGRMLPVPEGGHQHRARGERSGRSRHDLREQQGESAAHEGDSSRRDQDDRPSADDARHMGGHLRRGLAREAQKHHCICAFELVTRVLSPIAPRTFSLANARCAVCGGPMGATR